MSPTRVVFRFLNKIMKTLSHRVLVRHCLACSTFRGGAGGRLLKCVCIVDPGGVRNSTRGSILSGFVHSENVYIASNMHTTTSRMECGWNIHCDPFRHWRLLSYSTHKYTAYIYQTQSALLHLHLHIRPVASQQWDSPSVHNIMYHAYYPNDKTHIDGQFRAEQSGKQPCSNAMRKSFNILKRRPKIRSNIYKRLRRSLARSTAFCYIFN